MAREIKTIEYGIIDSTNLQARRLIEAAYGGEIQPTVLIAEGQTAGRGRLGRSFYSPTDTGLYTSLIIESPTELDKLISSVYEDKVSGKIPEDICVGLLEKYQAEKLKLQNERSEIEKRQADTTKERANVDEFISRLKTYLTIPTLTREMCMELIEFVTVDKCPGKYSKEPREIHIYYKLIDKTPPPEKKYLSTPTCEDC